MLKKASSSNLGHRISEKKRSRERKKEIPRKDFFWVGCLYQGPAGVVEKKSRRYIYFFPFKGLWPLHINNDSHLCMADGSDSLVNLSIIDDEIDGHDETQKWTQDAQQLSLRLP